MTTQHNITSRTADILVVDDSIESLKLLTEILTRAGYRVRPANGPQSALESALGKPPDVILLDVRMPEMDGFELCQRLKLDERTREVPIIFVSGLQDTQDRVQGFEAGGVDFISKPFEEAEVLARVNTHLQLRRMQVHLEEMVAERTSELEKANNALAEEILERKHAQLALEESGKKYRTVVEESIEGILIIQNGLRKYYNPALLEMTGYSAEEYDRFPFLSVVHPDDLASAEHTYRNVIMGREFDAMLDFRIVTKSGDIKWVSSRSTRIDWESKPASMIFFEDITERKQAEEALIESEEKFRSLVEQSPMSIQLVNPQGRITKVNQAFMALWGIPENLLPEVLAKYSMLEDEEARERDVMPLIEKAFEGEAVVLPVIEYVAANTMNAIGVDTRANKRWIQARLYPLKNREGEVISVVDMEEDITERKLAEEKIQQYQQRLKALATQLTISEEQERRRLAADLHDHVGHGLALARMQIQAVRDAKSQIETTALLNDLSRLLLKAIQDTKTLIFDLSVPTMNEIGLAAAISEWLEEYLEHRYGLETELIDNSSNRVLDPNVRAILFRNVRELFTNVIKHARAKKVMIVLDDFEGGVRIHVKDDGQGFEPEKALRNIRPDGGFGLFSIQERLTDLGGLLEILSEPGRGCEVIMSAPFERSTNEKPPRDESRG